MTLERLLNLTDSLYNSLGKDFSYSIYVCYDIWYELYFTSIIYNDREEIRFKYDCDELKITSVKRNGEETEVCYDCGGSKEYDNKELLQYVTQDFGISFLDYNFTSTVTDIYRNLKRNDEEMYSSIGLTPVDTEYNISVHTSYSKEEQLWYDVSLTFNSLLDDNHEFDIVYDIENICQKVLVYLRSKDLSCNNPDNYYGVVDVRYMEYDVDSIKSIAESW